MSAYSPEYERAYVFTAKHEGGWADVKGDPGGKTKFGIADLRDGVADGKTDTDGDGTPDTFIRDLTPEQAKDIFYREYWLEAGCPAYPKPMDLVVFDSAIHSGPKRAVAWYEKHKDYLSYITEREVFLRRWCRAKPDRHKFLNGFMNRLNALRYAAGKR